MGSTAVPYASDLASLNFNINAREKGWTIQPATTQDIPKPLGHIGADRDELPNAIQSTTDIDMLRWLTRT